MSLTAEQIEKNWKMFENFLSTKIGDRNEQGKFLCESLGERLALAPASGKTDYHNCFPGGLVDHSLRVLKVAVKLTKSLSYSIDSESLIISSLLHDIGKVGYPHNIGLDNPDFYVNNESEWHRKNQGKLYEYNKDVPFMTTPHRSIFVCQNYGLKLTVDEYLSILLNDGFVVDENKSYCLKLNPLVYVIQTSDYIATMEEKSPGNWVKHE